MELKKSSQPYHVFSIIRQWKKTTTMILFDILFVICLFAFAKLFDTIFTEYETQLVGSIFGYTLLLVYFLAIIFAHSFFKYCLFDVFEDTTFSFAFLGRFYLYNISMYGILGSVFFIVYLFFTVSLITLLKQPAIVVLIVLFGAGGYLFVQYSHIVFFKNKRIPLREIPKTAWQHFHAKKIGKWIGWNIFFGILFFVVYLLLFLGVRELAQKVATDPNAFTLFYALNVVIFALLILFCYFLLVWNRIYLFLDSIHS